MDVVGQVFIIFVAGVSVAALAGRLRLPAIVGELLAGVLIGPHVLDWIHLNQSASTLAALGVVMLLFTAGLEMRVSEVTEVGATAVLGSVAGVFVSVGAVFGVAVAFGYRAPAALLAAIALAATSVGIGTRALGELGLLRRRAGRVVMGAAIVDDVVVLVALSIALASSTRRSGLSIAITVASAVGFVTLVAVAGPWLARRHGARLAQGVGRHSPVVPALVLCLGLAALAERAGLAALIGAFLAGMVLAETREQIPLEQGMRPIAEFLVPFFFVTAGARFDPHALAGSGLPLALAIAGAAVAAKFVGCGAAAVGLRARERAVVGAGMIARGEVTLAAGAAALAAGRIPGRLFTALLAAVFVSALAGPLAIRAFAAGVSLSDGPHRPAA